MSLADAPIRIGCTVRASAGTFASAFRKYASVGLSAGRTVRVLARYPATDPRYVEVELDNSQLVTLPMTVAQEFAVDRIGLGGTS